MYIDFQHGPSGRNSRNRIVNYGNDGRTGDNDYHATFSGEKEALPDSSDILRIMDNFRRSYEESLSAGNLLLFTRIDPDIPRLTVDDPLLIQRLLDELSEYSLGQVARGCVVLELKGRRESDHRYSIHLTITMSGNGIPWDKEKDIFVRPSAMEKDTSGRTGATLYRAREISRRFNGDISVRNSLGFGTRFMVKLCLPYVEV